MQVLNVGSVFPPLAGNPNEATYFIRDESGFIHIDHFSRPTEKEIEDHKSGAGFQIQIGEVSGLIVICTKCGGQPWCDTTFEPRLYTDRITYEKPSDNEGYSLTSIVTDAPSGVIKSIRLIGLGHNISLYLYDLIQTRLESGTTVTYSGNQYAALSLQSRYTTDDLVRITNSHRWKLK